MAANGNTIDIKAAPGRFDGVSRPYTAEDVKKLRGSVQVEHTLARLGAEKLWELFQTDEYVPALGAVSGNQVRIRCCCCSGVVAVEGRVCLILCNAIKSSK